MWKILCFLVYWFNYVIIINAQSVSNVRLIDHTSYAISVVQETMNRVEKKHWCNLKVDDVVINVSENVLGELMTGDVEFNNGFLVSLERLDILQSTVQQVWVPLRINTTSVEVRATMRMLNAAIGFDVIAHTNKGDYRSTAVMRYPEIRFPFVVSKHLFTDDITVTIDSTLVRSTNLPIFSPENEVTNVVSVLFDWNCTADSIHRWATDIFTPIALDVAKNELEFPTICYNCSA